MSSELLPFGSLPSTWQWFGPSQQKTSSISGIHLPASRTFPIASQDATYLPPPPSPSWLNIGPGRSPKLYTLVFPYSEDTPAIHILLGLKKRGFGEGRINAFGGKPITNHNDFESPSDCALREFEEETGLRESAELEFTPNLKAHGRLLIHASNPSSTKDKFANELALLYIFSLRLTHEQLLAAKE
ncbi:hypothetical protein CF327_g574 [Tilletia walkeri]|uniref:Nudix hydrolase domain-containing protein n=1 Tax=Tilletia walkeri TaxID=117179 RepID=A0A8X7NDA9_9BASI|nr:hypothetical protein CF327_g574 [Tilletia walkeri]KAE8271627.1 hypothetical protein A4X09_0g741 [Tilletia walkeri]